MAIAKFDSINLRRLCDEIVAAVSHREVTALLNQCVIEEKGGGPRWEKLLLALTARQDQDGCGNNIGAFLQAAMSPVRFTNDHARFSETKHKLNEILAFSGLHLGEDGKLRPVTQATTIDEAQERAGRLRSELSRRRVHCEVLRFCKSELVQNNYFHAVFEATKSVAERIRQKAGLKEDGSELVDRAFGWKQPVLAINTLQTETEQSEQKGFANLLKGMFGTFRNVTAHAPKITWPISEDDALDLMTIASYLHRRLDTAVKIPSSTTGNP